MKKVVGIISLLFFAVNISAVVRVSSFNLNFYKSQIKPDTINESKILYVENVYKFLQGKESINSDFDIAESKHLDDVKHIFDVIYFILGISLFFLLSICVYLMFVNKYSAVLSGLISGSIISLSFVLFLTIFSILDFGSSFNVFHELFFPQGNWSFSADSLLIQLFPESFFVAVSRRIFLLVSVISIAVMSISIFLKRVLK